MFYLSYEVWREKKTVKLQMDKQMVRCCCAVCSYVGAVSKDNCFSSSFFLLPHKQKDQLTWQCLDSLYQPFRRFIAAPFHSHTAAKGRADRYQILQINQINTYLCRIFLWITSERPEWNEYPVPIWWRWWWWWPQKFENKFTGRAFISSYLKTCYRDNPHIRTREQTDKQKRTRG